MTTQSQVTGELAGRIGQTMVALGMATDPQAVRATRLEGGASNENFIVEGPSGPAVLRLAAPVSLGTRFGLDRWRGFDAHRAAEAAGVAPRLLAVGLPSGHSVVEFVDGRVLTPEDLTVGTNLEDVVQALKRVHESDADCGRFDAEDEVLRFCSIAGEEGLWLPDDIDELDTLCRQIGTIFANTGMPRVLAHNDVQIPNLIRGADGRIWIIDWEYAGRNNPYFDLSMLASNAGLGDDDVARLAAAYFGSVRPADLARIALERFRSAMRESLWSIVAEPVLTTGWDFRGWALQYLEVAREARDHIDRHGLLAVADQKGSS